MPENAPHVYADDGQCHDTAGFLFSHRCDRLSFVRCAICRKPICDRHSHDLGGTVACTACVKADPTASAQSAQTTRGTRYGRYYDDPFFYGHHYYPGYYSYHDRTTYRESTNDSAPANQPAAADPNDFTAGDSPSVRHEGDEAFESSAGDS